MEFEWDLTKAANNFRKHGVSFEEASTVFADALSAIYEDPDHSVKEHRFLTIGLSKKRRLLHVAFAERGKRIRIIQARKVTARERQLYEQEER